jgi:H+/Cl- antiporter ClcA
MMRSLLAFGNGAGGSSFPGSPVAGVYYATDETLDAVCAAVVSTPSSLVYNMSQNVAWVSTGANMFLLYATPADFASLPLPTTSGGVTYDVPVLSTGSDESTGFVSYFDGTDWISTGQP